MDPYKILGVSPDADDAEIKKAYRTLSKTYHPDNNPGNAAAEEKFKQIQSAYDQIMDWRKNGQTSYRDGYNDNDFSSFFGFRGFGGFGQNTGSSAYGSAMERDLQSAATYINNGHYAEGLNVLNGMSNRNGTWYFLSAIANYNLGNNVVAKDHITQAVNMEPGNMQFRDVYNRMQSGQTAYRGRSGNYDHNSGLCVDCVECIMCDISMNLCCGGC